MSKPIEFSRDVLAALEGVDITQPSDFRPGSDEKMLLMHLRGLRGMSLHVKGDRCDAQPRDRGERRCRLVTDESCVERIDSGPPESWGEDL